MLIYHELFSTCKSTAYKWDLEFSSVATDKSTGAKHEYKIKMLWLQFWKMHDDKIG